MEIFDEVFRPPLDYEPPAAAATALSEVSTSRTRHRASAREGLHVLDLGGNIGLFAVDALSRYPAARVTSYEPDPQNLRVLKRCTEVNPGASWELVHACAMTTDESVKIAAGEFADSHVSDSGVEVAGVDILPILGGFDFVKMDIEGSEWPILLDQRWPEAMRDVTAFVLEWHERGCPAENARGTAIAAVEAAGFTVAAGLAGWDHGVVWGWRSRGS